MTRKDEAVLQLSSFLRRKVLNLYFHEVVSSEKVSKVERVGVNIQMDR